MLDLPQINQEISWNDLVELNIALRKNADIGYQTVATTTGGTTGTLSALVPQSIENTLASATYTMEELVLWPELFKAKAGQTVHEYTIIKQHGLRLDPYIKEGGGGTTNRSVYERKFVKVKYFAERREVTDVAQMVGLIGPNPQAISRETEAGTLSLLGSVEQQLFNGDESLSPRHQDGILKQIRVNAPDNVTDFDGAPATLDKFQEILGQLVNPPLFGRPDVLFVTPQVHQDLINQATVFGRHDQTKVTDGTTLTYGIEQLVITTPYGKVPIKSAPFLFDDFPFDPAASSADAGVPPTPVIQTQPVVGAWAGTSRFKASDAGGYYYKIVGFGEKGYSAPLTTAQVAVVAGDKVKVEWDAAAPAATEYYFIWRSEKNALVTGKYHLIAKIPVNALGAAGSTQFIDLNAKKPATSSALAIRIREDYVEFARLLDFIRRPLAEVVTTKPFLLMLFGAVAVKLPTKCWVMDNIGLSSV